MKGVVGCWLPGLQDMYKNVYVTRGRERQKGKGEGKGEGREIKNKKKKVKWGGKERVNWSLYRKKEVCVAS